MTLTEDERFRLRKRLLKHIYIDEGNGCWLFKPGKDGGYRNTWLRGCSALVHRVSFAVFKGDFDDDFWVLHECDVKHCINPKHLFLGNAKLNAKDRNAKNRQARGDKIIQNRHNGMLGRCGKEHPMFGKKFSEQSRKRLRLAQRKRRYREKFQCA
jgi:hypothetical protein